jgi:hypothetical protein
MPGSTAGKARQYVEAIRQVIGSEGEMFAPVFCKKMFTGIIIKANDWYSVHGKNR